MNAKDLILNGQTALGIELGSTRMRGVFIDFIRRNMRSWRSIWSTESLMDYPERRLHLVQRTIAGFDTYMKRYKTGLVIEKTAINTMNW